MQASHLGGQRHLTEGADKIAQGDFAARVNVQSGDEVERLGLAFNAMAEKLEQSLEKLDSLIDESLLNSIAPETLSALKSETAIIIAQMARR